MELVLYKSLWEWDGAWQGRLEAIRAAGYHGVEYTPPRVGSADGSFHAALDALGLEYIAQVVTAGPDHGASFREQVLRAAELGPVLINSHSGLDRMSTDEQCRFFEAALKVEQEVGLEVAHETHRGRIFFTPWQTAAMLRRFPELKLGADLSHWTVACERMLECDEPEVALAVSRAIHIHGRVGYNEGPQVPDPRAPEYAGHVENFLQLWLAIAQQLAAAGRRRMTFTPEFGPPPYLQCAPYSQAPAADLWEVNLWMAQTFQARFRAAVPAL